MQMNIKGRICKAEFHAKFAIFVMYEPCPVKKGFNASFIDTYQLAQFVQADNGQHLLLFANKNSVCLEAVLAPASIDC